MKLEWLRDCGGCGDLVDLGACFIFSENADEEGCMMFIVVLRDVFMYDALLLLLAS